MNNQPSPIETLRQLREMLDAGTITAAEFETLKQQLIFTVQAPAVAPFVPDLTDPAVVLPAPPEPQSPMFEDAQLPADPLDNAPYQLATPPFATAAAAPAQPEAAHELADFQTPPVRNPLNLILAIGGLLVLLSVVTYLAFNQRDSEHISSNSMTAADSLNMAVEEGPQAEPVEQPMALPETVRVAPANPAPPIVKPSVAPVAADSTAARPAAVDSTQKP